MIEWFDPAVKLPEDGQQCLIMGHAQEGLMTEAVFGPIAWSKKNNCWLDLFRDAEAGTIISTDKVGCWTDWAPLAPPAGLPTPYPDKPENPQETV